jgi:hypothetical protein
MTADVITALAGFASSFGVEVGGLPGLLGGGFLLTLTQSVAATQSDQTP